MELIGVSWHVDGRVCGKFAPQTDAMTQVVLHLLDIVKFALPAGILAFVMQKMFTQYMEAKEPSDHYGTAHQGQVRHAAHTPTSV
jgi:hypothetical protein